MEIRVSKVEDTWMAEWNGLTAWGETRNEAVAAIKAAARSSEKDLLTDSTGLVGDH